MSAVYCLPFLARIRSLPDQGCLTSLFHLYVEAVEQCLAQRWPYVIGVEWMKALKNIICFICWSCRGMTYGTRCPWGWDAGTEESVRSGGCNLPDGDSGKVDLIWSGHIATEVQVVGSVPSWGYCCCLLTLGCSVIRHGVGHERWARQAGSLCTWDSSWEEGGQQPHFRRRTYSKVFYSHAFHIAGLLLQTPLKHRRGWEEGLPRKGVLSTVCPLAGGHGSWVTREESSLPLEVFGAGLSFLLYDPSHYVLCRHRQAWGNP